MKIVHFVKNLTIATAVCLCARAHFTCAPAPPGERLRSGAPQICSYHIFYHHCHAKNLFTNNWVYQILTSFGVGFIFIGLTLLLLIFQIIKFKFLGQVCFSQFE